METWLKNFKEESAKKFEELPSENSELFKYQTIFKDFENNIKPGETPDDGIKIVDKSKNVEIKPLQDVKLEDSFKRFNLDDKFVQMNNAFFDSGIFVRVHEGTSGILRLSSSPSGNIFNKTVILSENGTNIDVIKESYSPNERPNIISEDVLIIAKPNSKVTFSELQNYNQTSTCFSNKISVIQKDAKVSWNIGMFGGAKTRSRTYNFLEGDGSYGDDLQLTFGNGEQKFDAFSNLIHIGKSTTARSLAKGTFKDNSNSIFKGMIKIKDKAKNASSYLACHGMLLSRTAKANTIPGLEIETNDVKATHAASVSPIEEEKIFYLVSRGIREEDARKMITMGFFDPLIRGVKSEEIRAKMRYLIEMKWDGIKTESFEEKMLNEYMNEDAIKSGDIFEGHYKYR